MLGILEAHWYLKMYEAERLLSGELRKRWAAKTFEKSGKTAAVKTFKINRRKKL